MSFGLAFAMEPIQLTRNLEDCHLKNAALDLMSSINISPFGVK
jgi:hypothetical protein